MGPADRRTVELDDIRDKRWFAAKHEHGQRLEIVDQATVPGGGPRLLVVDVVSSTGNADRYLLVMEGRRDREPSVGDGHMAALAGWIFGGAPLAGERGGDFVPMPEPGARLGANREEQFVGDDQSNTLVGVGDQWLVKCYRRIHPGVHPEPELLRALANLPVTPRLGAEVLFLDTTARHTALTVVEHIQGAEAGWEGAISRLAHVLDVPSAQIDDLQQVVAEYAPLGDATAVVHDELRGSFSSREAVFDDLEHWQRTARADLAAARQVTTGPARAVLAMHERWIDRALEFGSGAGHCLHRIHGDLHLGQFLRRADSVWVLDFEGDPQSDFGERRRLDSPLMDLASLLRSLDHLLSATVARRPERRAGRAALEWRTHARNAVITSYEQRRGAVDPVLLRAFETHREIREFSYAATVLPEWSHAPIFGLNALVEWPG